MRQFEINGIKVNENRAGMHIGSSVQERRFVSPAGSDRQIQYGDRMFVRFTMRRGVCVEFMSENVSDMSELFGEIRQRTRGLKGLGHLYIRNGTRGWKVERPMMLYGRTEIGRGMGNVRIHEPQARVGEPQARRQEPRMLFPWETH